VIPVAFEYARATSLDDALSKMAASGGDGKFIAGGHSLVPLMKLRLSEPKLLIDIARVPELNGIRQHDGAIEIGAGTVHTDIAGSAAIAAHAPLLCDAAAQIGDPQVRNRGTLGGSIAHADPAADYPAVMLALDADIKIAGPNGARAVKASAFFQDLFTVDLAPNELITAVRFAPARVSAYAKLHQRASHFAIVGVAAALELSDGIVSSARIGLTGACPHAVRLNAVESALSGQKVTEETVRAATRVAAQNVGVLNADLHGSADYRRAMVPVFTERAILAAFARA
jgi:aerobic carbon-monoxide dehydrogenase medium subunit